MNKENFESKDILHVKQGDFEYLQFKRLKEFEPKIKHAITLRHGGVSKGVYSSLNFRSVGNDTKENVLKNLSILCDNLDISKADVFKGKQNHTDNILIIDSNNKLQYSFNKFSNSEYDGYICNTQNIATLVTTADCNPIILYDSVKNIYANIHSRLEGYSKKNIFKSSNYYA